VARAFLLEKRAEQRAALREERLGARENVGGRQRGRGFLERAF
jgi:hypothetical protein